MTKKRLWIGIGVSILFSIGILFLVVRDMNWASSLDAIQRIRHDSILLTMVFIGLSLTARALRWHYILCNRLSLRRSLSLTYVAFLINNLLPFRIGDLARIEAAARGDHNLSRMTTLSVAVMERLFDMLTLAVLFGITIWLLPSTPEEIQNTVVIVTIASLLATTLAIALATTYDRQFRKVVDTLEKRIIILNRLNLSDKFDKLIMGLTFVRNPRFLALTILWNALAWASLVVAYHILLVSLIPSVHFADTLLSVIAIAFAITVPTTIASLGIIEAGAILALTSQGYAYDNSFAFGVTIHVATLIIYAALGIYGMWAETLSPAVVLGTSIKPIESDSQVGETA